MDNLLDVKCWKKLNLLTPYPYYSSPFHTHYIISEHGHLYIRKPSHPVSPGDHRMTPP